MSLDLRGGHRQASIKCIDARRKGQKNREIDCYAPDRLTRDLTDKLIICRELEKNDVELIFVDTEYLTTPEGQLFFNMMSSIAQYELQLIKKEQ